jgi:hypothetical protein
MARSLVHRMVHKGDRPSGGSEWACPFCAYQAAFWPIYHKVVVKGRADVLHVRVMNEVPTHLDHTVLELTEADENWLSVNAIAWSGVATR